MYICDIENKIKVGDMVRVSEKTPIEYNPHGEYAPLCVINSVVRCVVNDYAMCEPIWDDGAIQTPFLIPTKYLVKVDAEPKEAKFKVNDVVRTVFNETTHITAILGNGNYYLYGMGNEYPEDSLTLVEPCTEPTEQTEAEEDARIRQMETELDEFRKAELDRMLQPEKPTFEVTIDNVAMNWQRYEAELAKEVALKVANKYNDPKEAAEYAISVAKAVVEGLKNK